MDRIPLAIFLTLILSACGGQSGDSDSDGAAPPSSGGAEEPGPDAATYPLNNIRLLARPASSDNYAGLTIYDENSSTVTVIGSAGEDSFIEDAYAVRVTTQESSYNVYISYSGIPTHIEYNGGQVFLKNIRIQERLADLEIILEDGNIFIEPDFSIDFLFRLIEEESSQSADQLTQQSFNREKTTTKTIPVSEAFRRLRNVIATGFVTKDFVECYLSTKVAITTGGLIAAETARSNCEGASKKAIEILDDGRIEITDERFISCATGECADILESITLDTLNLLIKRFEQLEEYARWSDEALAEIDKYPVEENETIKEPRFGGIITPERNEIINDPEFIVEVRLDDIFSSVNYASFRVFNAFTGTRATSAELLKDAVSPTRWLGLANMGEALNGSYILEIEIDHNDSRKIIYQTPFEYRNGVYEIYSVSTYSPIFSNKRTLITTKSVVVYSEDGTFKTRTNSDSYYTNNNFDFDMDGYLWAHTNDQTTVTSDGKRFPDTVTVCKTDGRFIPVRITRSGNVTGYNTSTGTGSISADFSISSNGDIQMSTSFQGTFEGSGYVDSFTTSINRSLSINAVSKTGNYMYSSVTNRTLIPNGVGGINYEQSVTSDGFSLSESEARYTPLFAEPADTIVSDSLPDICRQ